MIPDLAPPLVAAGPDAAELVWTPSDEDGRARDPVLGRPAKNTGALANPEALLGHDHVTVRLRNGRTHVLQGADHFGGEALIEDARAAVGRHAPPRLAETLGTAARVRRS